MNPATPSHPPAADPPHRILVVDDNRAIHEDFRKILEGDPVVDDFEDEDAAFFGTASTAPKKTQFKLDFASQGLEALEMVAASREKGYRYSLVFMDVRMPPGLDGIETTARLWEIDPDVQIVICTAYSDYSWEGMVERLGLTDRLLILKKPFDVVEVIQCAHALTGKWLLLQQTRLHAEKLECAVRTRTAELEKTNLQLNETLGELSIARDEALESVRLKSRFLANMSHEIRTPMNGVIGMAELLLHTELNADQRDYIDTIRGSADLLLNLINDLLDSSKIESGSLHFETSDFDLNMVVEGTLDIVGSIARHKGLELVGYVGKDVFANLRGDPGRLRQVLTNILSNAVKFTNDGEVILNVSSLEETETETRLLFEVRDTGIGIAKDLCLRIFEPFVQADGSDARKYGGTGLGLSISRQIVEALGGEIGVESEPGEGSRFWFSAGFQKQTGQSPQAPAVVDFPEDMRVLVVDDNATNRKILQLQLSNLQMSSTSASGGQEAMEMLRKENTGDAPFTLALLDMQMPGMDGLSLAKLIKSDPATSGTRLLLLSSLGDHLSESILTEAGVEGHLVKPLKQTRLHSALSTILSHHSSGAAAGPAASKPSNDMQKPVSSLRILLAEDNLVNQRVTLLQLQRLGYTADVAKDGLEVLSALEKTPYDVILMDCQMPTMDGYAATREIRLRHTRPIHIIAMTANAMPEERDMCLEAGMDAFLSKPVSPPVLGDLLEKVMVQATA
ncbi:response regulator [Luteolibacter yonseiensis]|uniref:histidine kinase n=1 Tax=Luteolibacter yonseiensis TaxID=1144680 RepID=A0A934V8C2_9BACT|nr:response regulator [Luteolibacter yonseiensis]MBK1817102.1 response regulator [Luteolibacter yonseiensis]